MTAARPLPQSWRWVRFGDVVRQVKETTKDPKADGLTRIVGLDHLDSESLPLTRWNELDDLPDGTSFTRVFRAGQVLFGKRRAYQRKVAVPEFDGVCSGDILVFAPASPDLHSEFLPYVVQSDGFFGQALGTSVGSLSPRTKWKDLAAFEFPLPPLDEQQQLAGLLSAASRAATTAGIAAESAMEHLQTLTRQFCIEPESVLGGGVSSQRVALGDICEIKRGRFSHRPRNEPRLYADLSDYPFVQTGDVHGAEREITNFSQYLSDEGVQYSRCVPEGTILVTIAAVIGALAYTTTTTYLPDSIVAVSPASGINARYLEFVLRGLRPHLESRVATENTQKNLSVELLSSVVVPLVPDSVQSHVASLMDESWAVVAHASRSVTAARLVETSLRERVLVGAEYV